MPNRIVERYVVAVAAREELECQSIVWQQFVRGPLR